MRAFAHRTRCTRHTAPAAACNPRGDSHRGSWRVFCARGLSYMTHQRDELTWTHALTRAHIHVKSPASLSCIQSGCIFLRVFVCVKMIARIQRIANAHTRTSAERCRQGVHEIKCGRAHGAANIPALRSNNRLHPHRSTSTSFVPGAPLPPLSVPGALRGEQLPNIIFIIYGGRRRDCVFAAMRGARMPEIHARASAHMVFAVSI